MKVFVHTACARLILGWILLWGVFASAARTAEAPPAAPPAEAKKESEEKKAEPTEASKPASDSGKDSKTEKAPELPEPTQEELAKREARYKKFRSLGEEFFNFPITGLLSTKYVLRSAEGVPGISRSLRVNGPALPPLGSRDHQKNNSDQDLRADLSMDFGDSRRHMVTGHFDIQWDLDLDGYKDRVDRLVRTATTILVRRRDTYVSPEDALFHTTSSGLRLYSANIDFNKIPGVELLRVGRQFTYETPQVLEFDGLRLDTKPLLGEKELTFSFYGGRTVHDFEARNKGIWDDNTYGASGEGRPWEGGRLRMDWEHVTDDFNDQFFGHGVEDNDVVTWSVWQDFRKPNVKLYGRFGLMDGTAHNAQARILYYKPDWRFHVTANYTAYLIRRQARLALELDPLVPILGPVAPYHQGNLTLSKDWTDHFSMDFGVTMRRLFDRQDEGVYNREYSRFNVTSNLHDLPVKNLEFSFTGSWWQGQERAATTTQMSGEVSYGWTKKLKTSVGTDYALFKYDFPWEFDLRRNEWTFYTERDGVRSWYLSQRWKPTRWAQLDVKYEFEHSRTSRYQTFTANFKFTF